LAEHQGTIAIVDEYFDGLHGLANRPLIADPENVALYRAQLQYTSKPLTLTAGRQRIALDDERFVGAVGFRQNGQTFDAARVKFTPAKGVEADISYAWMVRTIWGIDGAEARQQAISGTNLFANLAAPTPVGKVSGFAYLVDQDEALVQGCRLSSQSFGVRLAGSRALSPRTKISWQASYARQSDFHRNPNDYSAQYYLAEATLEASGWKLNAGYEVLGADRGLALTSFQTPLASGFKFQGWADKFLTIPPNGVRDLYAGVAWTRPKVGPIDLLNVQATGHRFRSDRLGQRYENELDLLVSAKLGRTLIAGRMAVYRADQFATDTRKFWLSVEHEL